MTPIYVDIHIHTSENPNELNQNYDVDTLLNKIQDYCGDKNFLISLTDHNTINKKAYIDLIPRHANILLGAELHIQYAKDSEPYHCHIFFDTDGINSNIIDELNEKLDKLYPNKVVAKNFEYIPTIEDIVRTFDSYDFMLLPHGGQSHSTFNESIPKGTNFDTTIERSIYYNQFDGFTARSDKKLSTTIEYFEKLGINEFINLVTCSDNYNPNKYPVGKQSRASEFVPTWMLSQPTYSGLRLALSESSRLVRNSKPEYYSQCIGDINLNNKYIDIDINLTPGLNVIIGSSSSGKTLLVDSIFNCITNNFSNSKYKELGVEKIQISHPSELTPHYLHQNYIVDLINENSERGINEIEIIKRLFPEDSEINRAIRKKLTGFGEDLSKMFQHVSNIEVLQQDISHITTLSKLIVTDSLQENILELLIPDQNIYHSWEYSENEFSADSDYLDNLESFFEDNPFTISQTKIIDILRMELEKAFLIGEFESKVRKNIIKHKNRMDSGINADKQIQRQKKNEYRKLKEKVNEYIYELNEFYSTLKSISEYSMTIETQKRESLGHSLYIENKFTLSRDHFLDVLNRYLKVKVLSFDKIEPKTFFKNNYDGRLRIRDYSEIKNKIYNDFSKLNKQKYKIITADNKDFDTLSAGWKTSILLDLILGYEDDNAPLIIDQPEDNLATDYINKGLIKSIKKAKTSKQIILVSHNATIPMLGDAQNVILCRNTDKIYIRNNPLEGKIDNKSIVDYIAEVTDGGKPSIRKRFKKYNLKSYRETT